MTLHSAVEHHHLSSIRAAVTAKGGHSHLWAELRREVFPGDTSWPELKSWCATNAMECEMTFSQSSRLAEVQFSRQRKPKVETQVVQVGTEQ